MSAQPQGGARRYPGSDELMAKARQQTGLSDFGVGAFQDGLQVFLESLERDAKLNDAAAAVVVASLQGRLVNRLEIEEWYRTHPEIENLPVAGPVAITGLERTGTTALASMLSLDDEFRCLRTWEQARPCPPPTLEGEATDPRRLSGIERTAQAVQARPELRAMHIFDAESTAEDIEVLGLSHRPQSLIVPVFSYHAWWRDCDMRDAYLYHRRVARLLQSRRPPNLWLFKTPHLRFHLEDFVHAYPEARFVMTHRDPARVVPSFASFVTSLYPPGAAAVHDMQKVGRLISEHQRIGIERAIEQRKRVGEHRFIDIQQKEIESDPLPALERIYAFLGRKLRPSVRAEIRRWQEANPAGAHGAHRYTPEQFGLSKEQLRSDFAAYIERFDVPLEG